MLIREVFRDLTRKAASGLSSKVKAAESNQLAKAIEASD
jgi:hypothetical protein